MGTHDAGLGHQIGPHRRDGQHLVAGVDQGLHRQHQGIHPARSHSHTIQGNPLPMRSRVVFAHMDRNGLAQSWQTQVVCVVGFTLLQRVNGRLTDKVRCDLIAFAKPKGQHIVAPQARIGHFADFRGL